MPAADPLKGVEAYIFDVFGTVVDWYGNITKVLAKAAPEGVTEDWDAFANEWRTGYFKHARRIAAGGEGTTNMDQAHRQILDEVLETARWKHLGSAWDEQKRHLLVQAWHKAPGWPDSSKGIYALKKKAIVAALSNGNIRFLIDLVRTSPMTDFQDCSILRGRAGQTLGPPMGCRLLRRRDVRVYSSPKVYLGALHHLALPPEKCAMVAAHLWDLRAAASHGMRTVYVPRITDDPEDRDNVKSKAEGGEVDLVVKSIEELAELV